MARKNRTGHAHTRRKTMKKRILGLFVLSLVAANALAGGLRKIPTRPDVSITFMYEKPEGATGVVVLFQGGGGNPGVMGNESRAWIRYDKAFLSGGEQRFVKNRLVTAIVDPPSDRRDLNNGFRNSADHNIDIAKLVEFLRSDNPGLPVWLIGTSNGSLTAAGAAIAMDSSPPAGIVLTSTVAEEHRSFIGKRYVHPIYRADLSKVRVPVLLVHHVADRCEHSKFAPIVDLMKAFPNAPKVDLIKMEGGQDNQDPCNGGYHQFLGQEQEVTDKIAQWLEANKR